MKYTILALLSLCCTSVFAINVATIPVQNNKAYELQYMFSIGNTYSNMANLDNKELRLIGPIPASATSWVVAFYYQDESLQLNSQTCEIVDQDKLIIQADHVPSQIAITDIAPTKDDATAMSIDCS